jgi:hypothetical protein
VGSVFGPVRFLLPVCRLSWFLYTFNIYMHISRRIFLSNYWWQRSDIWSQASYRYPISWEAFLDPSNSYFLVYKNQLSRQTGSRNLTGPKTLPTIWHTYIKLVTKYQIPIINSCLEKCDEKCEYTNVCQLNVYKNQQNRQTGSRNLTGPKTLSTIWHTYMKLVTKYQIPIINSCLEKCDEKEHTVCICSFLVAFFSATIDDRNLIFGHKLHIGTPYCGKRFLTHQIPTSCLPKSGGIISEH